MKRPRPRRIISDLPPIAQPDHPSFVQVNDIRGLPRVLLLGDSISMGYTLLVREKLRRKANVHHPAQNCGQTAFALAHLEEWLGRKRWDIIHFNFGLHDLKFVNGKGAYVPPGEGWQVAPPAQYGKNLRAIVRRLRRTGAHLIFATTTPVPEGAAGRVAGSEEQYNAIARRVMEEEDVAINDLWSLASRRQRVIQMPRDPHFTPEGDRELADQVTEAILEALGA